MEAQHVEQARAVPTDVDTHPLRRAALTRRHTRRRHEIRMRGYFRHAAPVYEERPKCSGCGTEIENHSLGCEQCANRHGRRRLRS